MKFIISRETSPLKSYQIVVRLPAPLFENINKICIQKKIKKQYLITQMIEHCIKEME